MKGMGPIDLQRQPNQREIPGSTSQKTTGTLPTSLRQIKMETDPQLLPRHTKGTLLTLLRAGRAVAAMP